MRRARTQKGRENDRGRRLDVFEGTNAEEHRLMQAQTGGLDATLQSRRRPRRRRS
jgi:hypothetical protein